MMKTHSLPTPAECARAVFIGLLGGIVFMALVIFAT